VFSKIEFIPVKTSGKTILDIEGIITATKFTLWLARAPAILLGTYPSAFAACRTFSRVL
jgi:hypothetical protein